MAVELADIGGGIGTQLASILDAFPRCRGILFDQPHVLKNAIQHDRIENVEGSFLEYVPKGADAYLLRWIIHDWAEPQVATILEMLHQALEPTAHLILAECVIPEEPEFGFGKWLDLQMLVSFGGRERTESEYRTLLSAAGFDLQEVVPTASSLSLIIAKPKMKVRHVEGGSQQKPIDLPCVAVSEVEEGEYCDISTDHVTLAAS